MKPEVTAIILKLILKISSMVGRISDSLEFLWILCVYVITVQEEKSLFSKESLVTSAFSKQSIGGLAMPC